MADRETRDQIFAVLAAVTLAVVVVGIWVLESNGPDYASDVREEEIEVGYHPGGPACDPSAVGPFPLGVNTSETAECQEAREAHRLQKNDFIQQRRAANAAATAAYLSHFQTVLGIVGMGFGFLTFCAAVAAAVYARRAAVAAEATVKGARDIGNLQLRAWLGFREHEVHVNGKQDGKLSHIEFVVRAVNSGSTPALNVFVGINSSLGEVLPVEISNTSTAVAPGEGFGLPTQYLTPEQIIQSRPDSRAIYVNAVIKYNDIFSRETRITRRTIAINYIGRPDVTKCPAAEVHDFNFRVMHYGESSMT